MATPNTSQASMWAGLDFASGLTVGLYTPIVNYARDGDCFSYTMATALSFTAYHKYFDDMFKVDALKTSLMGLGIATDAYGLYKLFSICNK